MNHKLSCNLVLKSLINMITVVLELLLITHIKIQFFSRNKCKRIRTVPSLDYIHICFFNHAVTGMTGIQ